MCYLANAAALLVAILIEAEQALLANQVLNCLLIRKADVYLDGVVLTHPLDKLVGFRMQPSGIQAEDVHLILGRHLEGQVDQDHVFGTGEGDCQLAEGLIGGFQDVLGRRLVMFQDEGIGVKGRHGDLQCVFCRYPTKRR